jgi:dihydroorotate dehydrogenase (fumarate)
LDRGGLLVGLGGPVLVLGFLTQAVVAMSATEHVAPLPAISAVDLGTTYMGLKLKHPIVASASPLSRTLAGIRQLEDAGASAIVMYSLFEEQISLEGQALDFHLNHGAESFPEALSYFPDLAHYNIGPDEYLELISQAKRATKIPIIASLNGVSSGGWIKYARLIEQAGADGLELNVYAIPGDPNQTGAEVEDNLMSIVREVRSSVALPLAVKLSPFYSSIPNLAMRLATEGADALVIFNRFYQPDIFLETLEVVPELQLSDSSDLRLRLRWAAILFGRVPLDLAVTGGVHTARVTMLASELLQNGTGRIGEIVTEMTGWLEDHGYASVEQMIGSMSERHLSDPSAYERANYMKVLDSWRALAVVSRTSAGGLKV